MHIQNENETGENLLHWHNCILVSREGCASWLWHFLGIFTYINGVQLNKQYVTKVVFLVQNGGNQANISSPVVAEWHKAQTLFSNDAFNMVLNSFSESLQKHAYSII